MTDPQPEPPLTRDEVAAALVALRKAAGFADQSAAARATGISQPTISRYERATHVVPERALRVLLEHYGADEATRRRLIDSVQVGEAELRRVVMHRPRAAAFQREYRDLERSATKIATFHPTIVPGLLQTDTYARAVAGRELDAAQLSEWLEARRERRAGLEVPNGRRFEQIVTAGALLWGLGGPKVMAEQIEHLVAAASRLPAVDLGVIGPGVALDFHTLTGFDTYELPDGERRVIVGTHAAVAVFREAADVEVHVRLLAKIRAAAVWGDDARAVLEQLARWYR